MRPAKGFVLFFFAAFLVRLPTPLDRPKEPGMPRLSERLSSTMKLVAPQARHLTELQVRPPKQRSTTVSTSAASLASDEGI